MPDKPGYLNGRHFASYVVDVVALKRTGDAAAVERLLLILIDVTEAESRADGLGVAPWYYEELAKLYRARKDYHSELTVLERYARQRHAPGVKPPQLLERLEKVRGIVRHEE